MKKNIIAAAIAVSAILSASNAFSAAGQVHFTGEIIDAGCDVVNNVSNPLEVVLGRVAKSEFTQSGDTAGAQDFTIQLINCPVTSSTARISFDGDALANDPQYLQLTQVAGVAQGVGIQLSDIAGVLPLRQPSAYYNVLAAPAVNNLVFTARYKSVGTVVPGPADAVASFSVLYN
ncbi:fimbrial protein [Rahnella bonaserana]|jgi:major type 1 subunit fimbrin (pilin)